VYSSHGKDAERGRIPVMEKIQKEYDAAVVKIKSDKSAWLSNTVLVFDASSSMGDGDKWGLSV
jgi:hypothetical protein